MARPRSRSVLLFTALTLLAVPALMSACSSPALITETDFGASVHQIRVDGGNGIPPQKVREIFDETARQICRTVDAKPGYRVLILLQEPSETDPRWDMPESYVQHRMAIRDYVTYQSNMEGKILCE